MFALEPVVARELQRKLSLMEAVGTSVLICMSRPVLLCLPRYWCFPNKYSGGQRELNDRGVSEKLHWGLKQPARDA
jgi:hypothetical protein